MSTTLFASMLLIPILLSAQEGWDRVQAIPPGQTIRVFTASGRVEGTFRSASSDSLEFAPKRGQAALITRADVRRVDAKTGSHRKRNTILGAVGAASGIATYASLGTLLINEGAEGTEVLIAVPAAVGAGIGAILPGRGFEKVYEPGSR